MKKKPIKKRKVCRKHYSKTTLLQEIDGCHRVMTFCECGAMRFITFPKDWKTTHKTVAIK